MSRRHVCFVLLSLALVGCQPDPGAKLGDPAAPLQIRKWVKGQSVDLAAAHGKQIIVVEFWATWCPPCRATIPHLTKLQERFRDQDVLFVGISDEEVPVVEAFVEQMGEAMGYAVAIDDDRGTAKGYLQAYGQRSIPAAFIVDKAGKVVWFGHPLTDLEATLSAMVTPVTLR